MAHPLSELNRDCARAISKGCGIGGSTVWSEEDRQYLGAEHLLRRASDALDAYHEALDGCEVVRCDVCLGTHLLPDECPACNGTGKRFRKKES
jgi:hypothetical protein